jgi:hypothetical protein
LGVGGGFITIFQGLALISQNLLPRCDSFVFENVKLDVEYGFAIGAKHLAVVADLAPSRVRELPRQSQAMVRILQYSQSVS